MKCRKARRLVPDFLNGRLPGAARWDVERHLEKCQDCRKEAEIFRAGLLAMKAPEAGIGAAGAASAAGGMDFTEDEWRTAIRKAVSARPEKRDEGKAPESLRLRSAFAYGLAFGVIAAAVLIGVRKFPWLVPTVETLPAATGRFADGQAEIIARVKDAGDFFSESDLWARNDDVFAGPAVMTAADAPLSLPTAAGDVPSFTWISPESGLQIVWFINDEIQLEE